MKKKRRLILSFVLVVVAMLFVFNVLIPITTEEQKLPGVEDGDVSAFPFFDDSQAASPPSGAGGADGQQAEGREGTGEDGQAGNDGTAAQGNKQGDDKQTTAPGAEQTPLPKSEEIEATPLGKDSVLVFWTSVSGAQSYNVYRSTSSGGGYVRVKQQVETSFTDSGLKANTTYYYRVAALRNGKEGSMSGYTTVVTTR